MSDSNDQTDKDPEARAVRTAELTTGFALNDITDDELRELHGQLSDPAHGQAAARTAWQTLETVIDLRAERSVTLQDTVASRIAEDDSRQRGITGRFLRHMGFGRKGLTAVHHVPHAPASVVPWWLLCALVCGSIVGTMWWLTANKSVARVVTVVGRVTVGSTAIGPGDPLDGRPLNAAAEAVITLRWPDGSQAVLSGPGIMIPSREGLSLLSGEVHLQAVGALALGLPDDEVRVAAGAHCTAVVSEGHSCLGAQRGVIESHAGPLSAGLARAAGKTFTWQHLAWTQLPAVLPTAGVTNWQLSIDTTINDEGQVSMAWANGGLTIDAQSFVIQQTGAPLIRTVRPPSLTTVLVTADAGGWTIRLHDEELFRAPQVPPLLTMHSSGKVLVRAEFTSGPPLNP